VESVSPVAEVTSIKTRAAKRQPGDGDVKAQFQISSSDSDETSDNDDDDYEMKAEEKRVASVAKPKTRLPPNQKGRSSAQAPEDHSSWGASRQEVV
jgi:hypothetical protein